MKRAGLACVTFVIFVPLLLAQTQPNATSRVHRTASGDKAVVRPVGKTGESVIDFFGSDGKRLCSTDYSSADGTHGFVIAKAEWTPDERFFVFSMQSSGGHSVMSTPTQFFSLREQSLCSLDSYVGGYGIEFADFGLSSPNTVEVRVNTIDSPVRVSLSTLAAKAPTSEHGCVPCKAGAVHIFGDKTQYGHSPN